MLQLQHKPSGAHLAMMASSASMSLLSRQWLCLNSHLAARHCSYLCVPAGGVVPEMALEAGVPEVEASAMEGSLPVRAKGWIRRVVPSCAGVLVFGN